jgi:C4-dicarboxylate transporter DctM subunit
MMTRVNCTTRRRVPVPEVSMTIVLLLFLLALLASGIWVAFSLLAVGMAGIFWFSNAPLGNVMATTIWGSSNSWALAALPLFIWMGEILFRSRLADDMFTGLSPWLTRLPGRLLHVNILGCGIFAAVSGSSAATAATIGKMSIPELSRRNYPEKMMIGTLAGSATLGLLIPPSIILIVYGVATEQSIARLFIAGIIPGLFLVGLFVGYVVVWSLLNKQAIPEDAENIPFKEKLRRSRRLIPIILLIAGVIGSIYAGIASPTDAAAVGVLLSLLLSKMSGTLNTQTFLDGLMGATKTSCMIAFILAGAAFLTVAMGFTGIPRILASWIVTLQLSPYALLAALTVFFIVLGCFLDGISVVVLTTSVIMPMVEQVGIDPLWFGIFIVLVVEMAQITPPVGFNLFVIQGQTGMDILKVAKAAIPFFLLMLVALITITIFPQIVTLLPNMMGG